MTIFLLNRTYELIITNFKNYPNMVHDMFSETNASKTTLTLSMIYCPEINELYSSEIRDENFI